MSEGAGSGSHYFALPAGSKLYEFEIEAVLGHGGFGITYRATDTLLQETVAIKEFLPNELAVRISDATVRAKSERDQPDFDAGLKSFLEEARVMARFRHPRIVHVRRFFELHGTGYIVLDYEHGKTLSERLSEGPVAEPELRSLLSGVLDGLEVIHDRAILHRDLKPNNVMLREDGAPVIIDFGAARDFQARHSRSITAIATAGYAPPEQYGVGGQQGPWSDLYAVGAIAYRAVSGEPPVDSLRRLRKDPLVPAVVAGAGKYDGVLLRTIDWMLKIDEAERPVSVAQVREALRGGAIPMVGPEVGGAASYTSKVRASSSAGFAKISESGTPETARPASRRGRAAAIAVSILVLAGLAVGSYAFYANYQAKKQADLQAKQQAERQTNERQRQLAEQLANAGTDQSKLEFFLTTCGLTCPDDLRTQAQVRIDTTKQKQQAELARQDEAAYRAARGDLTKLRAYATSCTTCIFRDAARSEISSIEQQPRPVELAAQQTLGLDHATMSQELRTHYNIAASVSGVVITNVDPTSEAAEKRLSSGDVIVEVAQQAVNSAADVKKRIEQLKGDGKKSVLLLIANGQGERRYVALNIGEANVAHSDHKTPQIRSNYSGPISAPESAIYFTFKETALSREGPGAEFASRFSIGNGEQVKGIGQVGDFKIDEFDYAKKTWVKIATANGNEGFVLREDLLTPTEFEERKKLLDKKEKIEARFDQAAKSSGIFSRNAGVWMPGTRCIEPVGDMKINLGMAFNFRFVSWSEGSTWIMASAANPDSETRYTVQPYKKISLDKTGTLQFYTLTSPKETLHVGFTDNQFWYETSNGKFSAYTRCGPLASERYHILELLGYMIDGSPQQVRWQQTHPGR